MLKLNQLYELTTDTNFLLRDLPGHNDTAHNNFDNFYVKKDNVIFLLDVIISKSTLYKDYDCWLKILCKNKVFWSYFYCGPKIQMKKYLKEKLKEVEE